MSDHRWTYDEDEYRPRFGVTTAEAGEADTLLAVKDLTPFAPSQDRKALVISTRTGEVVKVTGDRDGRLEVVRGYGATTAQPLRADDELLTIGFADPDQ